MLLEIKSLYKSFHQKSVVTDVSFSLARGEVLSIIGPSGSGKSTLLKLIVGLEKLDGGDILISGVNLSNKDAIQSKLARRQIGYIFQDFALFDHLTVKENIGLASRVVYKKNESLINQDTKNLLDIFGISDKLNSYPMTLSGGEKQRVAITRSLITKPSILLFDEPTSALDQSSINDLIQMIVKLKKDNIGILIVTHDLNFAKQVSDRLLFMRDSSIIFSRDIEDISDFHTIFDV